MYYYLIFQWNATITVRVMQLNIIKIIIYTIQKNSDLDIKRQMRKIRVNANLLLRKFSRCSVEVKCYLFNPIRSGLFQIVNDPGGGGGALKAPPPYDLENYYVNLHHIIHVNFTGCFWHDPIGIFQKFAILTILQRFQNKK